MMGFLGAKYSVSEQQYTLAGVSSIKPDPYVLEREIPYAYFHPNPWEDVLYGLKKEMLYEMSSRTGISPLMTGKNTKFETIDQISRCSILLRATYTPPIGIPPNILNNTEFGSNNCFYRPAVEQSFYEKLKSEIDSWLKLEC